MIRQAFLFFSRMDTFFLLVLNLKILFLQRNKTRKLAMYTCLFKILFLHRYFFSTDNIYPINNLIIDRAAHVHIDLQKKINREEYRQGTTFIFFLSLSLSLLNFPSGNDGNEKERNQSNQ